MAATTMKANTASEAMAALLPKKRRMASRVKERGLPAMPSTSELMKGSSASRLST